MRQLLSTNDIWTSGIVNVPLDPNLRDSRYTFFELDSKSVKDLRIVFNAYMDYLNSVYIHETMKGFHFFNLKPVDKASYGLMMRQIKHLNTECPMTTLRILPNKWIGESRLWGNGQVIGKDKTLEEFKSWLEGGSYHMIQNNYQVVRYKFERKQE